MAGGSLDWQTLLDRQKEMVAETKAASTYSKIAATTGVLGVILALIALLVK